LPQFFFFADISIAQQFSEMNGGALTMESVKQVVIDLTLTHATTIERTQQENVQ
jgi:hypothetical protein